VIVNAKFEQKKRLGMAQALAALWSIVFLFSVFSGYFLLLKDNVFFAVVIGAVLALLAWSIARFIGSQENGVSNYKVPFALLLILSAVGIMNFLMLNLEGRQIFNEAITNSEDRFTELSARAEAKLKTDGVTQKKKKVADLTESLISEIKNPLNCGQGPEARSIMQRLQRELPGFAPLSNPSRDCSRNDEVIADYKKKIDGLVIRAPWNNNDLTSVISSAQQSKKQLQSLEGKASNSFAYALMLDVAPELQGLGVRYRGDFERLSRHASNKELSPRLELKSVESLGEWSQLINLVMGRWNVPSTWLYMALAVFFDYLTIYFFDLIRRNRLKRPVAVNANSIGRAW